MRYDSKTIPDKVLRLMPAEERARLGKAGRTLVEVFAEEDRRAERKIQQEIAQFLRMRDIPFDWKAMHRKSTATVGWPDFTLAYRGIPLALEAKTATGKCSPEQAALHTKLAAHGWGVHVVRGLPEVKALLDAIDAI